MVSMTFRFRGIKLFLKIQNALKYLMCVNTDISVILYYMVY